MVVRLLRAAEGADGIAMPADFLNVLSGQFLIGETGHELRHRHRGTGKILPAHFSLRYGFSSY